MNILIKGVEMPTDCTECWFRKTARHEYLSDCQICPLTGETTPYTKRKDDCPLVLVPEHDGPLVDALDIINAFPDEFVFTNEQARALTNYIIPADPAKEGEG